MIKSIWAPGPIPSMPVPATTPLMAAATPALLGDTIHFGTFHLTSFGNFTIVTQGVTLDLASTNPQNLGVYGVDTYLNFENVWRRRGNDNFFGTNGANALRGMAATTSSGALAATTIILGGLGQDLLIGDAGADHPGCRPDCQRV